MPLIVPCMPRKNANKIPTDWVYCSKCGNRYGFISCRITIVKNGVVRNICLTCASKEEKESNPQVVNIAPR